MHPSRQLPTLRRALHHLHRTHPHLKVLYVGRDAEKIGSYLGPTLPLYDAGSLPAPDVSACFAAMNLYLVPFEDGTSTRRGSFLVAIQHGVPTVSTSGPETDRLLKAHDNRAFRLPSWNDPAAFVDAVDCLANRPDVRQQMAHAGQVLYAHHFEWSVLATRLLDALQPLFASPAPAPSLQKQGHPPIPLQSTSVSQ